MKKFNIILLSIHIIFFSSCSVFNPTGSWITERAEKTYHFKASNKKQLRAKEILPNHIYYHYAKLPIDTTSIYKKLNSNGPSKYIDVITFSTKRTAIFNFNDGTTENAFRISNKENPSPEILNEAIAKDIKKRYPIKLRNWKSGKIRGRAWRFENVDIQLSKTGLLSIRGTQKVNQCLGFTGKILVDIVDEEDNILVRAEFKKSGLGPKGFWCGKNKRSYNDDLHILGGNQSDGNSMNQRRLVELLIGAKGFRVRAEHTSSGLRRLVGQTEQLKQITNNITEIGGDIAKIYGLAF